MNKNQITQAVEEGEEIRVRWSATECDCLHCAAMFWPREPCDFCCAGDIVEGYVSPLRDEPLALMVEEVETDRESAAAPAAQAAQTPGHWLDEVEELVDERAGSCHTSGEEGDEEDWYPKF